MGSKTGIEWTDATWNPIRGCSPVSPGCKNCYASKVAKLFSGPGGPYEGLVRINRAGERTDEWNGVVRPIAEHLLDPLKWRGRKLYQAGNAKAVGSEPGMRIFVNSMSDLFHENLADTEIDKIFAVMALCPQHTFQVLTKRPQRMLKWARRIEEMVPRLGCNPWLINWPHPRGTGEPVTSQWPLKNVWLGVSVENQKAADERIPLLLETPARLRFISAEPLLGPVLLHEVDQPNIPTLDWVICGGESGPGARPMHPDWARSLRDQCTDAGVPFFFKQWGEWAEVGGGATHRVYDVKNQAPTIDSSNAVIALDGHVPSRESEMHCDTKYRWVSRVGKHAAGAMLDGREWHEFPKLGDVIGEGSASGVSRT
jgi:protein gp37